MTSEVIDGMLSSGGMMSHRNCEAVRNGGRMERRRFLRGTLAIGAAAITARAYGMSGLSAPSSPLDAQQFRKMRRFTRTPFGNIAYVECGSGDAALFLHGFPLNGFQWRGALDRLSGHRRCIAPDLMAMGYSRIPHDQSLAPAAQVGMLAALLDKLSIRSVDLIANDSGGAVAQLFLARFPERVRTLLLTNCDAEPDSPPPALLPVISMAHEGRFAEETLGPWLADKALARSPKGLGGLTYSDPTNLTDEIIEYYLSPLLSSTLRKSQANGYAIALEKNPLAGIEASLRKSRVAARIVWGTGDTIFSQDSPEYLNRILPGTRGIRRVPGAKLFFPEEYPDIIAEEAALLWSGGSA
jgi:haloalkane dehalogenase